MDSEESSSQNKYGAFALFLLLLLIGVAALFLANSKLSFFKNGFGESPVDLFQFNQSTELPGDKIVGEVERPAPLLTDIDSREGDARFLTKILKGYFHEYDSIGGIIELKNMFLGSPNLQLLEASVKNTTSFYCWPEKHNDGTREVDVRQLEFYVYSNGQDIIFPGERRVSIDLLDDFLNSDVYLVIQLIDNFNINNDNQVQKLILLGC